MTEVRDPDLCVITCALSGVLANRAQCPAIPYTPVEIAEEAKRAYDAGAAAVHIHARHDDGTPTFSPATFAKIKEEIEKRCPVLLNFSTGTIVDDVSEQCQYIRESRPAHRGCLSHEYALRRRRALVRRRGGRNQSKFQFEQEGYSLCSSLPRLLLE